MNDDYIQKSWVGGVCIRDGKVLLVHRINNRASHNKEYFVFPGKEVHGDETLESALINAFKDFSITVTLGDLFCSKEDTVDDLEYYYLCDYVLGEPAIAAGSIEEGEMEEGEQVYTPLWVDLSDIDELIVYPESVKNLILENI
jgi:ADP-ribose pyrophosphatase YjhB (NUDIX family)